MPPPPAQAADAPGTADAATGSAPPPAPTTGAWAPLRLDVFRRVWLATVVSNLGGFMNGVAAAWLMTSLAPTPDMVALVQTMSTLPVLLLALPCGALADIVDRRKLLIGSQIWILGCAALAATLSATGHMTPALLLVLTGAVGVGLAFMFPAFSAIVPELIPRPQLRAAIALNGIAMNASRSVGPALAGLMLAVAGAWSVFASHAVLVAVAAVMLFRWQRPPPPEGKAPEQLVGAIVSGVRYVWHTRALRAVLTHGSLFFFAAAASWALLPVIAHRGDAGPGVYGFLLALIGIGAIAGALLMPRMQQLTTQNRILAIAEIAYAACLATLALVQSWWLVGLAMFMKGVVWMTIITMIQVSLQSRLPGWVRARVLGMSQMSVMGGLAIGSFVWGHLAALASVPVALGIAAVAVVAVALLSPRLPTEDTTNAWSTPGEPWPMPRIEVDAMDMDKAALVSVEYRIDPARAEEFVRLMRRLGASRKRNGAVYWALLSDVSVPGRVVETFADPSWEEHVRHHERVTKFDEQLMAEVLAFHEGASPPKVTHYLAM
jgi:MFS family permease